MIDAYFKDENSTLYLADSLKKLKDFPAEYVDVIFADPPYFLSNDGFTCKSGFGEQRRFGQSRDA